MGCSFSIDEAYQARKIYPNANLTNEGPNTNSNEDSKQEQNATTKQKRENNITKNLYYRSGTAIIKAKNRKNHPLMFSQQSLGQALKVPLQFHEDGTHDNQQGIQTIITNAVEYAIQEAMDSNYNYNLMKHEQQQNIRKFHHLSFSQISKKYDQSEGNLKRFFESISEKTSKYFMDLSIQALQKMNDHKMSQKQCKVFLSQHALLISLDILSVIGLKTKYNFQVDTFRILNKSIGSIVTYLKSKYPRAGTTFVPGDLTEMFKNFDAIDDPRYDILRNANITFNKTSDIQIVTKIKQTLNKIFQELDTKFPIFQKFLQQKIFVIKKSGEVSEQSKPLQYKINRKIPENVAKFTIDDSGIMKIDSPELFRTLIKWLQSFEQWFDQPNLQEFVAKKNSFKCYLQQNQQITQQHIVRTQDIEQIQFELKQKLKKLQQPYQKQLSILKNEIDIFNSNLMRVLHTMEHNQKYIPNKEVHIIKYVHYNMKLVSWMLIQMLIFCIKNLIKIGEEMKQTKARSKFDFVNFKVSDLMRAMVKGNKKQILQIYENVKRAQQLGLMKIIRIKSRLGTPLNDVMIIFLIKQSYIICQLQLVLKQSEEASQKLKNIQFMNHYLYELERSPYGVLPQSAVVLDYNDSKISNADKITFNTSLSTKIFQCKIRHPQKVALHQVQRKPIICNNCAEFYEPLQNIFQFQQCMQCHIFQCCMCMFEKNSQLQNKSIQQRFKNQIIQIVYGVDAIIDPSKIQIVKKLNSLFFTQRFCLSRIFNKNYEKIKGKDLLNFFKQKIYQKFSGKQNNFLNIQTKYKYIYFLFVQFSGTGTYFKIYYWNKYVRILSNSFKPGQTLGQNEYICTSPFDYFLIFNEKGMTIQNVSLKNIKPSERVSLVSLDNLINSKKLSRVKLSNNMSFIVGGQTQFNKQKIILNKKHFSYKSLEDARSHLPDLQISYQNIDMKNFGLTDIQIKQISNFPFKDKIKYINFSDNKIRNIQVILAECLKIEDLVLSKNYIQQIVISHELKQLYKLNLMNNNIKTITGLSNLKKLQKLNIQDNYLQSLQKSPLEMLLELNISENKLITLDFLTIQIFPKIKRLFMSNCGISKNWGTKINRKAILNLPKLIMLDYSNNLTDDLTLTSHILQYLNCEANLLKRLNVKIPKIQRLILRNNSIENLKDLFDEMPLFIKELNCQKAGHLQKFPEIVTDKLTIFNVSDCFLSDLQNIKLLNSPNLEIFDISKNKNIKNIPQIRSPNLRQLNLQGVMVPNLLLFGHIPLPMPQLKQLILVGHHDQGKLIRQGFQQIILPKLVLHNLTKIQLKYFDFKNINNLPICDFPKIKTIILKGNKITNPPSLNFENLQFLDVSHNQVQSIQQLFKSNLPTLFHLDISYNKIKNMCEASFLKQLAVFQFFNNPFQNVLELQNYPSYKDLTNFSFPSTESIFFKISFITLKQLTIQGTKYANLDNLQHSNLPNLQFLKIINNNKLKCLPILNLPKVKKIQIRDNTMLWDFRKLSDWQCNQLENLFVGDFSKSSPSIFGRNIFPKLKKLTIIEGIFDENSKNILYDMNFTNLEILQVQRINNFNSISNLANDKNSKLIIKQCKFATSNVNLSGLNFKIIQILQSKYLQTIQQFNLTITQKLSLSENSLNSIKDWKIMAPNLRIMKLDRNNLKELPNQVQFSVLQILDINDNKFVNLQLNYKKIPNLQQLYANNNLLQKIQPIQIKTMKIIQLNNNKLSTIDFIEKGSKLRLQQFSAQNNKIQSITSLCKIQKVNLKKNKLTNVKWLQKSSTQTIINLNLSYNQIKSINQMINNGDKFRFLESLNLQFNQLKQMPNITLLYSLQSFYSRYNAFENFDAILQADLENYKKKQQEVAKEKQKKIQMIQSKKNKQKSRKNSAYDDISLGAISFENKSSYKQNKGLKILQYSINPQLPRNQIQQTKTLMKKKYWFCVYKQF